MGLIFPGIRFYDAFCCRYCVGFLTELCGDSVLLSGFCTTQKMKFYMNFFSKYDQIRSFLRIWSHFLKNHYFILCAELLCRK